ncbi:efflux transporter outer membrane subunit [Roseateles chitosanitabidus]|uniref:efflux transporter outer membrane subunit n=1 Tax=Roseateles chitosanitabidus TaxID=65048 RepID=UPI00083654F1|nr:efflux transporter outer membrane subunit [Roseateles chitosanitabidus]
MKRAIALIPVVIGLGGLTACGSLAPADGGAKPPMREDFRVVTPAASAASALAPIAAATGASAPASSSSASSLAASTSTSASTATADAANEWYGFFADERIDRVVAIALDQSRSLRASTAAVARVRAQYRIAESDRLPQLSAGVSATRQRTATSGAATTYAANLGLAAYEIDLFDRLGSLEGAALSRFLAEEENQRSARLSLVAEVTNAWLTLAAERQRLLLAEQLRDSQRRTLDLTERQYQLGATSGLDRARARTAFESARGDAARSAGAVEQARLRLELLAGQPLPDALLPTGQDTRAATALPELPGGLPADVLLRRPDLRAAEQRLRAASFDVGAARAARFPRLTLTASAGTRSSDLDELFKSGSGVWSLMPSIDLPIFDGGARKARVEVSEATRQEAIAGYELALQSAFREVADALAVRDRLAERLDAQQAQVAAAEQTLRLAEQSYRLGSISQLELLDAQRQLAAARQQLVTLRQTEQANRVELMRVLGGRWQG